MLLSFIKLTFRNLIHRRVRSILTIIGIIIGTSVVVALVFLGDGLKNAVTGQLQQFGSNLIFVVPWDVTNPIASFAGRSAFRDKDVEAVREVEGVEFAMPTIEAYLVKGEFKGEKKTISLHAQSWQYIKKLFEESQGFRLNDGDWPRRDDLNEVVLGASVATNGFREGISLDDELVIRGHRFRIVGILRKTGEQNHDNNVFVSLETFRKLTGKRDSYMSITIRAMPGEDLDSLAGRIELVLKRQNGLGDFTVMTAEKAGQVVAGVIGLVSFVLFLIATVAVVVGGIGIMNTMYTSVLERTREIGIMKSVGASNRQILLLFLLESGQIGIIGGVCGLILGIGLSEYVAIIARGQGFQFLAIKIEPLVVFWVLLFMLLIGVVAGLLPAKQATRYRPSEALKYR